MKKRVISCVVLLLMLLLSVTACSTTSNNLVVGTSLSFPPYEYEDGKEVVGVDIDIMKEISRRMGKDFVLETMDFDDLFVALSYHKIDVIAAGLTITEERKQQFNFTVPYAVGGQTILIKKDAEVEDIEGLKTRGTLIGVEKGTTGYDYAQETFNQAQLRDYDDASRMMDALESGVVSAVVIDIAPATIYANQHPDLTILDLDIDYEEYALGLAKDSEYYEQVNSILQEMIEDGTVNDIIAKYNMIE